jgi:Cu2+-exporting ATPase
MKMEREHSHHEHKMHQQDEEMKHSKHEHQKHNRSYVHEGHDHHAMMIEDFKKRFYVVLILTVPIMLLSQMIQHWLNLHLSFTGSQYVLLLLSSIVFFYGGFPFLKRFN